MTSEEYIDKLKQIEFFKDGKHPELIPFVGFDYPKYKILQIGESHFIPNHPQGKLKKNGEPFEKYNEITLDDFSGWWEGNYGDALSNYSGWFNTKNVVDDYIRGYRDRSHGIFTNTLKSFCRIVAPSEAFESISTENGRKYNYFAFMNFYQQPSVYEGENFTSSLYRAGKYLGMRVEDIDSLWYEIFDRSVKVFERVVEILEPNAIVVTSEEVHKYYGRYGSVDKTGQRCEGKYTYNDSVIWVDHPGCSWWNRVKNGAGKTSRIIFEDALKQIYKV